MTTNRISPELRAAMKEPGNRALVVEMTPARKERMKRLAHKIVDLLSSEASAEEAFLILQTCMETLQKTKGIKGGVLLGSEADQT